MPRQKQSKPKALKQQREEVEQLIRDGGTTDPKKQDGHSSAKLSRHSALPSPAEKDNDRKGKKRHRHKSAMKVKIAKKVRNKRMTKALRGKQFPANKNSDIQERVPSPNPNNNEKLIVEIKEQDLSNRVEEVTEAASDSYISDTDVFKDKYDMIKERSLKRAIKVKQTTPEKEKLKDLEGSPKKSVESPKKSPVSPVKAESHLQKSPTKAEPSPVQLPPKPKHSAAQRKSSEREGARLHSRNSVSGAENIVKGRQHSVSEGMLTSQEASSKQQALEALLQITGVEFHTMSKVPTSDKALSSSVKTVTTSTPNIPETPLAGLNKSGMVKINESDKGIVKYHLQSDSLEQQGLKLVYTAHTVGQTSPEQFSYSAYRQRKNSTRSNASDSADDPSAKDSQKCCKKPGRHVCQFCGRRCTKPSVLKKHIRSHTGERPYPCLPCGFSFKTKSNLYKHCKTHAHAIKAGLTPNSEDLSKLVLPDLDEDDSEETESEDEITACDATTCQTELTEKCSHSDSQMHVGSIPHSEVEPITRTSLEDKNTKPSNIPMMQVPRSLAVVPNIPRQQADSQSNQETISRHSSSWVSTQNSVLPTTNIKKDLPVLSALLPIQTRSSESSSAGRPSSAPSASLVDVPKSNPNPQQDRRVTSEGRSDEEVVMSASGASSSQLLKSLLPGELAGFRIDMATRRAIPVLNPQLGTQGVPSTTQSGEGSSSNSGQLLIPLTGFNIVKSGGQYHVQIPVQGIPEDSLTMSLDGDTGSNVDDTTSIASQTKGVSKESLQERIQLLISQNRAIVDNAVLESVKPRRTSTSRRDSENNSPRIELSAEPPSDVKFADGRGVTSSVYPEFMNLPARYRRDSLSEAQQSPSITYAPLAGYPLPGEGNLLERVLKSQQQSSMIGATDKPVSVSDPQVMKVGTSTQHIGNPGDNSNSIKDLLMQDRPHRLAQIAQHSPVHMSGDSPGGRGSPGIRYIPGSHSWPTHVGDSAMSQLRGTLQQHRVGPPIHRQMYPSLYSTAEDVNISQRISELKGTGRRRKYKSESDVFGEVLPAGPSSPKRRARKIKDIPTVVSPLATGSIRHQSTNLVSSKTPTEHQKGIDVKPAAIPHESFSSFPGRMSSQLNPLSSPSPHLTTYPSLVTSKPIGSIPYTSSMTVTTSSHMTSAQSHMESMQSHLTPAQSHMTPAQSHMTPVQGHMTSVPSYMTPIQSPMTSMSSHHTTIQNHMTYYPSPVPSVPGRGTSHAEQLSSVVQNVHPAQGTAAATFRQGAAPATLVSVTHTQPQPSVSEVSVIQHTRMQSKCEPTNKELKLEVSHAREEIPRGYPWPYRYPIHGQSPGAGSPASQGLHLLAVASKSPDLPAGVLMGNRKRSFSITEGMENVKKYKQEVVSPWPKENPAEKTEKRREAEDSDNAAPIAMQLLAAVAHSSSHVPGLSPRVMDSTSRTPSEAGTGSQSLPDLPSKDTPSLTEGAIQSNVMNVSKQESLPQPLTATPEVKQSIEILPEAKKIKVERNSGSPKSPRSDARTPRSDTNKQSPTSLPRVPASRRHLTLDLKSPLTSRVKSPGASESPKSLLQIDPKSLLTPEALSIAESVMKLASPMKASTPITPVESARELGRLMAHAFHNAGGKVESLITSTQGTMMIGPIATPTPGSGSGSTQYFIIPSPSTSQPPTGFPGPNTSFSPSATTTASTSLVSPLRSPLAASQLEGGQQILSADQGPRYKRVPPQKPDCQGTLENYILNHVKTNSALRQRIWSSELSRSMARNSQITQTTFCCVQRPQPMYVQQGANRKISMYSNWRPGGNCPHPLGISWKAHLGLYDTGRNKKPRFYYVTTSISPPQCGIVTDSAGWKPETANKADRQSPAEAVHQQMMDISTAKSSDAASTVDKPSVDSDALKAKEKKPKEMSDRNEPSRIQIFTGGYKSNEDYVYVRGRGRGKYVCEECGIRCKKPSMLKKHIRTHTDMRPYQCQICNFAFKTKGNLTKHMKSKAHSKKCTKNGLATTDESGMEHQFSDADDEDTDSADGETSEEDEEEDEDDDISETHSESSVPVCGSVPPRERYSSVPNIQDMHETLDSQGRPLVWHQYHPGRVKKGQSETHDRPRRDSTGSIPTSDSAKCETASKESSEDKQPVKLSRSEVVGKLSRHLTNRHQQSLEKAQKAGISAAGKPGDGKDPDSHKAFDISQLPPFHPGSLLPQPTKIHLQIPGSKTDTQPPAPPVLDKYGHIVLTMSNSSSQYRLSTTVQDNLSSRSKPETSSGNVMETQSSALASVQSSVSSDGAYKELTSLSSRKPHFSSEMLPVGSQLHSKLHENAGVTSTPTTSVTQSHISSLARIPNSVLYTGVSQADTCEMRVFSFPPHHEIASVPSPSVPPGASNLVVGVNPMHALSNREMQMFPHYPVSSDAHVVPGASLGAYQSNFGVSPQFQRMISPSFLPSYPESTRPLAPSNLNSTRPIPVQSPSSQVKPPLSSRFTPSAATSYPSASNPPKSFPPPIFVEAISDDEDEHGPRKRQKVGSEQQRLMVSGSINNPGNPPSSIPWMSEPGSAIKQLLLARPSLVPPYESAKPSFISPFLPPSLASPQLTKSSPVVSFSTSSSLQPPLVSPMVPSKMMQLPPTILSQVRSPTVQLSSFPPRDEHRDSPGPFVPPVAKAKTQFQWTPQQSQFTLEKPTSGDQIPVEVAEEIVSSPTHAGNHKCSSCNKVFMKPSQLRIHMRIHLEENSFSCPECMTSFPTRILLAKHERSEEHLSKVDAVELPSTSNESDPRPFKCKECQIAFRIPGHLAKHLRSRGHRMTLEREGKLHSQKEELLGQEIMSDVEQGDLVIDDTRQPSSPAGSSDKTDSASEAGDLDNMEPTPAT